MKVPTFRTFSTSFLYANDYIDPAKKLAEKFRGRRLLREMVANPDYQRFKSVSRKAARGDIRMNIMIPEEGDKLVVSIADRKNPTVAELFQSGLNLFRAKSKKVKLPTMSNKEFLEYFKNLISNNGNYPVRVIKIDPKAPYSQKIEAAIKDFANERLFGSK